MNYLIKKGRKKSRPFVFGLSLKRRFKYKVMFDTTAKYFINDNDDHVNTLFGIGYFTSRQKERACFGWRYNENLNRVEILAYCYVHGQRFVELITTVPFHISVLLELQVTERGYGFTVKKSIDHYVYIGKKQDYKFGYRIGVAFDANQPAPHDIKIELKKL